MTDLTPVLSKYDRVARDICRTNDSLSDAQRAWLDLLLARHQHSTCCRLAQAGKNDYVGHARPSALLVGDTPGTAAPSYGAFTPWPNGCGEHLMNCLIAAHVNIQRLGVVNSKGVDLTGLWVCLGGPRVIALGRIAHNRLNAANIPVAGFAYHPQFEKRFRRHWTKQLAYGESIKESMTPFGHSPREFETA